MRILVVLFFSFNFILHAQGEEDNVQFRKLFSKYNILRKVDGPVIARPIQIENPAQHTFIFFANASADHWVPSSSTVLKNSSDHKIYGDAVTRDVDQIRMLAEQCASCNVVILLIERPAEHFLSFIPALDSNTVLWLYSRGRLITHRVVQPVNVAHPQLLSELLQFSQKIFPHTQLHLIYRGHSFYPNYMPGSKKISPFDIRHPESPYGIDEFVTSIREAGLDKKLASLTLAGCGMAFFEIAEALSPFTGFLLADQVGVLETLNVGFRYDFLDTTQDASSVDDVVDRIGKTVFSAFDHALNIDDAMMEYPITAMDLRSPSKLTDMWHLIKDQPLTQNIIFEIKHKAHVFKTLSDRYVAYLKSIGKTERQIMRMIKSVRIHSPNKNEVDVKLFLSFLSELPHLDLTTKNLLMELQTELQSRIKIYNQPAHSNKGGLSVQFE